MHFWSGGSSWPLLVRPRSGGCAGAPGSARSFWKR